MKSIKKWKLKIVVVLNPIRLFFPNHASFRHWLYQMFVCRIAVGAQQTLKTRKKVEDNGQKTVGDKQNGDGHLVAYNVGVME